ncbi:MAG TPA: hypothetical protein VGS99_00810 [Gammaproteobacteria bacterium]|nr:hypothetical protein [Gammaproteobacteria bacterium]
MPMYKMVHMGRIRLLNVLAEAALIVFSILLALYTNHWREERAEQQRVQATLAEIRTELEQNRAILAEVTPYHQAVVQRFERFLAAPELMQRIKGHTLVEVDASADLLPRGVWNPSVRPEILSDAAWKSAIASGALTSMSPALLRQLTAYYSGQEIGVQSTLHAITQLYMTSQPYDPGQTLVMLRTLQGAIGELSTQDAHLLGQLDDTLRALPPTDAKP